jgi:large subunit ribosomal protein L6
MSRVGNKILPLPAGVTVTLQGSSAIVKGSKGELTVAIPSGISFTQQNNVLTVTRENDTASIKTLHGTTRANLANAVTGVSQGYKKDLELVGIGFRSVVKGQDLILTVGYSHEVVITPLPGVKISVNENTKVSVEGVDKQAVGQVAASIRAVRKPEPYQGKGIRYKGEYIRRKEGKRAAASGK